MKESDTGRIKKTDQSQKIRTEICRIFLIAKWRLIHYTSITYSKHVVVAGVKLKILKANHNPQFDIWRNNVVSVLGDWFKNNWAVNVGTRKNPVYKPLYTYIRKRTASGYQSTFDFHAVVHSDSVDDSSPMYYVTKYLFKPSKHLEKFKKLVFAKYQTVENQQQQEEQYK